jgi:tetratricopeptide (TPR) repeat protein
MKIVSFTIVGTLLMILAACSGSRYLEMSASGEEAFRKGDFRAAMAVFEEIMGEMGKKGKQSTCNVYSMAGISAFELGEYPRSLDHLIKAQQMGCSGEEMYLYLIRNYRQIDNLSKEITALEAYLEKFPQGSGASDARKRLLQTCLESGDFELARKLWMELDKVSREDVGNLETYLQINRMQGNDRLCDSLAAIILAEDPDSEPALKWFGEYYFWKAENSYQYQMKAYEENHTRKQYAILLEAFKQVSIDFRKSRDYFLKLYKINPDPGYAAYLGNIYTRLEDDEKAGYYRKRAE